MRWFLRQNTHWAESSPGTVSDSGLFGFRLRFLKEGVSTDPVLFTCLSTGQTSGRGSYSDLFFMIEFQFVAIEEEWK